MFRLIWMYPLFLTALLVGRGLAQKEDDLEEVEDLERVEKIQPRHYVAYRTAGQIRIDGKLDEPSWQRAAWTERFVDIEGADRPAPPLGTWVKMVWDDDYLYVGADLEEPHVWATLTERDAVIYHDDDFEVFIDPDGDTHQYYEFEINARGAVWDLLLIKPYRDGGPPVSGWQIAGMKSAVKVWGTLGDPTDVDQGWGVELAFPWDALGECAGQQSVPPEDGDQWRINFSRVEWKVEIDGNQYSKIAGESEDTWVWSPQGIVNMHYPEQWGFVQFSTRTVGETEVECVPRPEEEARRVLRRIYHLQRRFREKYGRYTASLDSLGIGHPLLRNYLWPPKIQATEDLFEASFEEVVDLDQDGRISRWVIRQDSRVWKE